MHEAQVSAAQPTHLLIVEDDDDSRDMLSELAELYGYRATGAATARAAIALARDCLPKLALVDIGLADGDGYEVAQQLRRLPDGDSVWLVALTGYSDEASRERAQASGFNEFVVKPLLPEKLNQLLNRLDQA